MQQHTWIPKEVYGTTLDELKEKAGFGFPGGVTQEDIEVVLPPGWRTERSGEWLYILDSQERKRAVINEAHDFDRAIGHNVLHWLRRYGVEVVDSGGTKDYPSEIRWRIVDSDSRCIHEGNRLRVASGDGGIDEEMNAIDEGVAWLYENKPDWQDYFAYWDE